YGVSAVRSGSSGSWHIEAVPDGSGRFRSGREPSDRAKVSRADSVSGRTGTFSRAWKDFTLRDIDIYDVVGEDGFRRLVAAFYRQVPDDDILGPMYPPDDMEGAEERLRDFLVGRFGGPQRYMARRGDPRLRIRHMPFPIDTAARDRWVELMSRALDEVRFPPEADALLRTFFDSVATALINRMPSSPGEHP